MNVNLGSPYEKIIQKVINRGFAGTQTEVIRQALMAYDREMDEREARLLERAVDHELKDVRNGKAKSIPLEKFLRKEGLQL